MSWGLRVRVSPRVSIFYFIIKLYFENVIPSNKKSHFSHFIKNISNFMDSKSLSIFFPFLFNTFQFTSLNQSWFLISLNFTLWLESLVNIIPNNSFTESLKKFGNRINFLKMLTFVSLILDSSSNLWVTMKGGYPTSNLKLQWRDLNSYINTPSAQISTFSSCPLFDNISGAKYSNVPTKEYAFWNLFNFLQNPKSINLMFALLSKRIFSHFKSLWMYPFLWIYSKAEIIWEVNILTSCSSNLFFSSK
jgi:hypothetical protein